MSETPGPDKEAGIDIQYPNPELPINNIKGTDVGEDTQSPDVMPRQEIRRLTPKVEKPIIKPPYGRPDSDL